MFVPEDNQTKWNVPLDLDGLYTVTKCVRGLTVPIAALERLGLCNAELRLKLRCCQRDLLVQLQTELKQKTIMNYSRSINYNIQ